jgi:hypothetical protein
MSKRDSGYPRMKRDLYETPRWVVDALCEVVPNLKGKTIWEPACGTGRMAEALKKQGVIVRASDIHRYRYRDLWLKYDFLSDHRLFGGMRYDGIITNPPYGERGKLAEAFIERGLERTVCGGFLALLLPADFDHAKTRTRFFAECPRYSGQIKLRRRINWFQGEHGSKDNHCWHLWQQTLFGEHVPPRVWWAPRADIRSQTTVVRLPSPARGEAA